MKHKFVNALSLALIMTMLFTSVGLADQVVNTIDNTIDPALESRTIEEGESTVVGFYIKNVNTAGGDPVNQCNASGGSANAVTVTFSVPTGVTANPDSLVFTDCDQTKYVTFSSSTSDSYNITIDSVTGGRTGSTWDTAPAAFELEVEEAPVTNTAPTVSVTGVTHGASYNKGSVPAAMCQVTDLEDGNSTFAATLSAISGPYASDGIGSQTANCSYTDAGLLTANASATYSIVDPSAPSISYVLAPPAPDGSNGWYKNSVTLTWNVSEPDSPSSLSTTGCVDQNITADQAETAYSCSATSAGGSAGSVTVNIKRDGTAPSVTVTPARPADVAGWYNAPVVFDIAGTDATSGVLDTNCTADQNYAGPDGSGLAVNGSCTDNAGNAGNGTSAAFNFDDTNPTLAWNGSINHGDSFYFGSVPATPTCTAADATSGPASCGVVGYGTTVGTHILTATAYDVAGNSYSEQRSYEVKAWTLSGFYQPVDMNGVVNVVKGGSTVPLKFEVSAGSTELTAITVVKWFTVVGVACNNATADDIELTTTGGTTLRYDATAGQFIQNWQTPRAAGSCYRVTMTTQDGSTLSALFRLK